MLPIPHIVLLLPFCVFTGLAIGTVITQFIERMAVAPRKPRAPIRPSAQIYYFKPGKTSLRSYSNRGSLLAMPRS